jgi:hypothetical protein
MEVIKSFTGVWNCPVIFEGTIKVKETISIIHCDELYLVMRVRATDDDYDANTIVTKDIKSYAEAIDLYEEWNKELMWHMHTT